MSQPPPMPTDPTQRNIIDRLAHFVAKNGPEFEAMTRQKQEGNPEFDFLYPGHPHEGYYRFKIQMEVAQLLQHQPPQQQHHQQQQQQQQPPPPSRHNIPPLIPPTQEQQQRKQNDETEAMINAQLDAIQRQITDSERNLKAQFDSLQSQQQSQIDATIAKLESEKVVNIAKAVGLNVDEFSLIIDELTQRCSKDAVSKSKHWVLEKCQTDRLREVVLMYLLYRVREPSATDQGRLHVLYLINDWAHYCMRKKQTLITQMISRYVPQMYCFSLHMVTDDKCKEKLEKLMSVWEGQKHFDDNAYKQLRVPQQTYQTGLQRLLGEYQNAINEITNQTSSTYHGYEKQHQEYVRHAQQQITALQMNLGASSAQPKRRSRFDQLAPSASQQQPQTMQIPLPPTREHPPSLMAQEIPPPHPATSQPSSWTSGPPPQQQLYQQQQQQQQYWPPTTTQASGGPGPPPQLPAISALRPGYSKQGATDATQLIPTAAYYDLPAGLMIPLVKKEDHEYKPLDPGLLRLPPPVPPSERLIAAMEAFYSPAGHDNPRDSEGWEKLGLYEFYRVKGAALDEKRRAAKEKKSEQDGGKRKKSSHEAAGDENLDGEELQDDDDEISAAGGGKIKINLDGAPYLDT